VSIATIKDGIILGKAKVTVDIVDRGNKEIRPETPMNPSELAYHNTGNEGKGANAELHNRYIHNMADKSPLETSHVSWHFTVDAYRIFQHLPINECAFHTGDGFNTKSGNRNAIGIEICMHKDATPAEYTQAEENAIALGVHLMQLTGIKIEKVKPHQAYSGKFCPAVILKRDGGFTKFQGRIKSAFTKASKVTPVSSVVKSYLSEGDNGNGVKELQTLLSKVGYDIKIDGDFGEGTLNDVRDFQKKSGLTIDGFVGKETMTKLKEKVTETTKPVPVVTPKPKPITPKPVAKPVTVAPKPVAKPVVLYGKLTVLVEKLNVRKEANLTAPISKTVSKGESYKVYSQKNGLYCIGTDSYCTSNSKYVKFVKNPDFGKVEEAKTAVVLADTLFTYTKADWDARGVTVKKGESFTVIKELVVSGAKMYQLKSGAFITANPKLVKAK